MLLREEKNPQPKLPEGVPTLLPPMHLAAVILTAVIHNVTLKHNSAQGKPPSHKQHRFVFFPGACHSPCWIACEKGEKNRACGRGKSDPTDKFASKQVAVKQIPSSLCLTESLGLEGFCGDHPVQPPHQGRVTQSRLHRNQVGFECPQRETPPTSLGSLYFQIQFFRKAQV